MTLVKLIRIVDKAYPDGLVVRAHKGEDTGDTLALFIARELADTYDLDASNAEQISSACTALGLAADELQRICSTLEDLS